MSFFFHSEPDVGVSRVDIIKKYNDIMFMFDYINSRHPNIRFTMEKETHHKLPFLDVLVNSNDPNSLLTSVYRKKTFTGLLTNYFSFTSYSYKVGLIRTLVDRAYKINNTWPGLHEDITKLMDILKKNIFPAHLIERVVNRYITGTLSNHSPRVSLPSSPTFYFKLPYIGLFFCRHPEKSSSPYQALL